jgi:hypothetical protein
MDTDMSDHPDSAITVADRWTYDWEARKKPAIHPLRSPAGHTLTRMQPDDHPWHRALWFTIKYVGDDNFWEEQPPYGVLRHESPPELVGPDDAGRVGIAGRVTWTRPDRETTAIVEVRRLTHVPLGDHAYAIDVDTMLTATTDTVLDRTPFTTWGGYGGLALRGRGDWHDTRLMLDDGEPRERAIGVPSRWCDLTGPVGESGADDPVAGIAFLDHPDSPRHPVPWYASTRAATYGDEGWSNFVNAAFLFHEALPLPADEPLRFRYRVVVHDGWWDAARIDAAWEEYAADG